MTKKFNSQLLQVQEEIESIRKSKARLGLSNQLFEGAEGAEFFKSYVVTVFCTKDLLRRASIISGERTRGKISPFYWIKERSDKISKLSKYIAAFVNLRLQCTYLAF